MEIIFEALDIAFGLITVICCAGFFVQAALFGATTARRRI